MSMISKTKLKIVFFLILSAALLKFTYEVNKFTNLYQNKVYPNVFIDGVAMGGKNRDEVKRLFAEKNAKLNDFTITALYKNDPVSTFSAQTINLKYDGETPAIQSYMVGRSKYLISRNIQIISSYLNLKKYYFESALTYNNEPVREFVSIMEGKYNRPAENALFKFENGRVVSFKNEKRGLEMESDLFMKDFDENIKKIKKGNAVKSIALDEKTIRPEITLASSNDLGIEEVIAVGTSNYSHSIPGRIHNVILAASKFNGVIIPPGETFSFNKNIGDISAQTGYQQAYIIKEGKTVLGDGGGVCQVSTTLFRAALNAGLPVTERHAHAYRVGYYENDMKPGFDATVFSPSVDLKVKNDTPASILIETEVDEENMILTFRLYGKKDNRKVEIGDAALWGVVAPPPAKYQDDPTLKKGVTKQVDFPAWGSKASFTYKVTKDNKITTEDKFYSYYQPWAAVYLVGTAD